MFNNLGHLFTYKTGPQIFLPKVFKHDIICIIDDNNLIHNINIYNNLQFWPRSSSCCQQNGDQFMVYFTLRMRDHPRHISIRLANIYSILSSINIYPLLNTVLKIPLEYVTLRYMYVHIVTWRHVYIYMKNSGHMTSRSTVRRLTCYGDPW